MMSTIYFSPFDTTSYLGCGRKHVFAGGFRDKSRNVNLLFGVVVLLVKIYLTSLHPSAFSQSPQWQKHDALPLALQYELHSIGIPLSFLIFGFGFFFAMERKRFCPKTKWQNSRRFCFFRLCLIVRTSSANIPHFI